MNDIQEFKAKLDKISPTFCIAKWKQVTMHLESGLTHSCHHPTAHIVPFDELDENITALHNTKCKKLIRKKMLKGEIIPECEYCNNIEAKHSDYKSSTFSDRIYKSKESWAKKYFEEIINKPWDDDVFPSYFEVSFSSVCNCSCMYCSPTFSTGWTKHIKKFGEYPTSTANRSFLYSPNPSYLNEIKNPYIQAFMKWWPELYKKLDVFRITGGEPLLSKYTFDILDYIIENPRPDLKLDINSNFCVDKKIFSKFIDKFKRLKFNKPPGVFTSCEAKGLKANYIRPGMDYNYWLDNCRMYLKELKDAKLYFMCTYNILSITSFTSFLKVILELKREYPLRVFIDIPTLLSPPYFQANIITKNFLPFIEDSLTFMYNNHDVPTWAPLSGTAFYDFEISKLRRIYTSVQVKPENKGCIRNRKDFVIFIDEYDKRYGTNFLNIFPEYEDFYYSCKEI